MGLLTLIAIIVLVGIAVYFINAYAPLNNEFKVLVLWVGIIGCVLLVLNAFGVLGMDVTVPKIFK